MDKLNKNLLEWAVFAVGLVLLLGVLGALVWEAAHLGSEPPHLAITIMQPEQSGGLTVVEVQVINNGDQAAENVVVAVTMAQPDGSEQEGEFTLDLIPHHSAGTGTVAFRASPDQRGDIQAHVIGYILP